MRRFTFRKASACETEHALDNLIPSSPPKKIIDSAHTSEVFKTTETSLYFFIYWQLALKSSNE